MDDYDHLDLDEIDFAPVEHDTKRRPAGDGGPRSNRRMDRGGRAARGRAATG
ncbi:DUF6417 family protein [Streptomyces rishiriensis]|uniref:DUF6417 family protein n=1 Tax=Streptomyces rishiriensis TaxID=68264 RepID=UPI0035A22100